MESIKKWTPWTTAEIDLLKKLVNDGLNNSEISIKLGRTPLGVRSKINEICRRPKNQHPKASKKKDTIAKPDITIDEICRRASELNMSYGKYTSSEQYYKDICDGIFMSGKYKKGRS